MRVVLQRVAYASVSVGGDPIASIGSGLLLFVGVAAGDGEEDARRLARKCAEMRVFADDTGKFNLSLLDTGGEALVVSQFTLHADVRRGRRPDFTASARPEVAAPLVEAFADALRQLGVGVECGRFGAHMMIDLVNDGPVTIIVDSADLDRPRG